MAGGFEAELARAGAIEDPRGEHAVAHERAALARHALAVEGMRAQAAPPQRIVDDRDAGREQPLAHAVLEEAGLARDRAAVDGGGEMADERAGDARVEDDRHAPGRHLARIEPAHGALAGRAADQLRRREVGGMDRGGEIVVLLHAGAFAGDRLHRHAMA